LLQYLFTTGLVGLISYIGLFVSSVVYMLRNVYKKPWILAAVSGCVAYFAQGTLNLNQPITTPFYFVFLAVGVGAVNYDRRTNEVRN
ncbi:MAG: hypothetical protein ACI4EK_01990, partial [Wujia sp.]